MLLVVAERLNYWLKALLALVTLGRCFRHVSTRAGHCLLASKENTVEAAWYLTMQRCVRGWLVSSNPLVLLCCPCVHIVRVYGIDYCPPAQNDFFSVNMYQK